jgi:hypothetical protein
MTVQIDYDTPGGIDTVRRDDYHFEKDGWVTAYDNPDDRGVENFIQIPRRRVIRIER